MTEDLQIRFEDSLASFSWRGLNMQPSSFAISPICSAAQSSVSVCCLCLSLSLSYAPLCITLRQLSLSFSLFLSLSQRSPFMHTTINSFSSPPHLAPTLLHLRSHFHDSVQLKVKIEIEGEQKIFDSFVFWFRFELNLSRFRSWELCSISFWRGPTRRSWRRTSGQTSSPPTSTSSASSTWVQFQQRPPESNSNELLKSWNQFWPVHPTS